MKLRLAQYSTLVFDCDGVVLDSNRMKREAFRSAALPWGADAAEALVSYHVKNGGISRYAKFNYFLEQILPEHVPNAVPGRDGPGIEELLNSYARAVYSGLMSSTIAEGLQDIRAATLSTRWIIVSGGDQDELRRIFSARGLTQYFDGGIFGSPDTKDLILSRELMAGTIKLPALFLGDSRLDHEVAQRHGVDFMFVSNWTEFSDWSPYTSAKKVSTIQSLSELLKFI
jgi:phosphoglycolate phosphatase-like HAD superfamily hydrolase